MHRDRITVAVRQLGGHNVADLRATLHAPSLPDGDERVAVLLAEQNATMALQVAQHGYVMENGRIVLDGDAKTISQNEDIKEFYLGLTGVGQRKSYRDVKHYRRRKRWLS